MIKTILLYIISAAAWFCAGYYFSKIKSNVAIQKFIRRQESLLYGCHELLMCDLQVGKPVDKAFENGHCIYLQYENNHRIFIHLGKVTDDQMRKDIVDKLNNIINGRYV